MENNKTFSNVYRFYGNSLPYFFFKNASSNGFISNGRYYKEVTHEKNTEYVKSDVAIKKVKNMLGFKILVNFLYIVLILVILFGSYNNQCLEIVLGGGIAIGIALWYILEKYSQIFLIVFLTIIAAIVIYGWKYNYYEIAYLVYFSVCIALVSETNKKIKVAYRVYNEDGKGSGYFIWTDGKSRYKVKDKVNHNEVKKNTGK